MLNRPTVLFVCVHNAGRSQMAAAYLTHLAGDRVEVRSAGSAPADTVNPAVVEALAEGYRSPGLQARLDALEGRKAELERELGAAPPRPPILHPNLAVLYRRQVERLQEALSDLSIRDEAVKLLRGLVERVALSPAGRGFEIEIVGDIAKMIELPGAPENSVPDPYRSSVKVVAGARSQRCLGLSEGWL